MKPETLLMTAIFGETSTGHNNNDFLDNVQGRNLREVLLSLLDSIREKRARNAPKFSERVKPLILARYGFDGKPKTYKELGEIFGVTRERARQNVLQALRMLRHPSRSSQLKPFIK